MKKLLSSILQGLLLFVSASVLYSCQSGKPAPPEAGTLTAYYAKEEIKDESHDCKKGELYLDSNNPNARLVEQDNDNYKFKGEWAEEPEIWTVPKSMLEEKNYKMYQLSAEEIGSKAVFVSDKDCTARIFWSNINGHKYCSWDGKEVNWNETSRREECYILSVELINSWDGDKYLYEVELDESKGYFKLYQKKNVIDHEVIIGNIVGMWGTAGGWDNKKSAYSEDGKLLTDLWEIDGIPDELSIAYLADENALYINGDLYYRK